MQQLWREIRDFLRCEAGLAPNTNSGILEALFLIRNAAPQGVDDPSVVFHHVVLRIGVNGEWTDIQVSDLASGETFTHTMQVRPEDLAGLQWNLDASIDSEAFSRITRQPQPFNLRRGVLPMQAYFRVVDAARIHRWREEILPAIRNADPSATLGSIRQQQEELRSHIATIRATAERLQRTLGFLTPSEVQRVVEFHHTVGEYLQSTEAALAEVAESLSREPARAGDRAAGWTRRLGELGRRLDEAASNLTSPPVQVRPPAGGAIESISLSPARSSSQVAEADSGGGTAASAPSGRSPNDDRSDSMNPNSPAHQAAMDNRSNQMNPNNPAYGSSRGHR